MKTKKTTNAQGISSTLARLRKHLDNRNQTGTLGSVYHTPSEVPETLYLELRPSPTLGYLIRQKLTGQMPSVRLVKVRICNGEVHIQDGRTDHGVSIYPLRKGRIGGEQVEYMLRELVEPGTNQQTWMEYKADEKRRTADEKRLKDEKAASDRAIYHQHRASIEAVVVSSGWYPARVNADPSMDGTMPSVTLRGPWTQEMLAKLLAASTKILNGEV